MTVLLAKSAGFCFGVDRIITGALEAAGKGRVYTLGPVIHNKAVVAELADKGVEIITNADELAGKAPGTVIIRSHGVPCDEIAALEARGQAYLDYTCPDVKKIHKLAEDASARNRTVVILGDGKHPEVAAIKSRAVNAVILKDRLTAAEYDFKEDIPYTLVSQTTFNEEEYEYITAALKRRGLDMEFNKTVCKATADRQREAESISKAADIVFILGDRGSANSLELFDICKKNQINTFFIENTQEIEEKLLNFSHTSDMIIGVTAGASTPPAMIKEAVRLMNELNRPVDDANEKLDANGVQETAVTPEVESAPVEAALEAPAQETPPEKAEAEAAAVPKVLETEASEQAVSAEASGQEQVQPGAAGLQNAQTAKKTGNEPDTSSGDKEFAKMIAGASLVLRTGETVRGKVIKVANGEVFVDLGYKCDGVIQKGQYSDDSEADPAKDLKPGDDIDVYVVRVNDGEGNVLLSKKHADGRKSMLDIEQAFKNNTPLSGKIVEIVKGGCIALIRGVRTFVPSSQASQRFIRDLNELKGKEFNFNILEFDKSKKRIVAGRRDLAAKEQQELKEKAFETIGIGDVMKGTVSRIAQFGAFVDLGGVDGLIHISEMSWGRIRRVADVVREGDEVTVAVIGLSPEKGKISLSLKDITSDPWENIDEKYPIGSIVDGKVARIASFGAFVELEDGVDGLVHISQVASRHIEKVEEELKVGQLIKVKVTAIDRDQKRISLSKKVADNEIYFDYIDDEGDGYDEAYDEYDDGAYDEGYGDGYEDDGYAVETDEAYNEPTEQTAADTEEPKETDSQPYGAEAADKPSDTE